MWVYIRSEPGLLTVGFFDSHNTWHSDSDHSNRDEAAARVNYLNGGHNSVPLAIAVEALTTIANNSYDGNAAKIASAALNSIHH